MNYPAQRCDLCQMAVYGNMAKHRTSKLHLKLKNFVHPICELCDKQFQKRIDWDVHKLSAAHLIALEKDGHVVMPTGNSLSDQRNILTMNPKFDDRLFEELHVQYMLFYIELF